MFQHCEPANRKDHRVSGRSILFPDCDRSENIRSNTSGVSSARYGCRVGGSGCADSARDLGGREGFVCMANGYSAAAGATSPKLDQIHVTWPELSANARSVGERVRGRGLVTGEWRTGCHPRRSDKPPDPPA
jgi:hypothetical protein